MVAQDIAKPLLSRESTEENGQINIPQGGFDLAGSA
jgi:hypothetical protein